MNVQFDIFSDILSLIRLSGTVYFRLPVEKKWAMACPASVNKLFYIIESGEVWLNGSFTDSPIRLGVGDILTFPHGNQHFLSAEPQSKSFYSQADIVHAYRSRSNVLSEAQSAAVILWGHIHFQRNILHPFLKHLPPFILIRSAERGDLDWLKAITDKIVQESLSPQPGSAIVIDRLAELLHIYMLRAFMLQEANTGSYWKVLGDLPIYQALQQIHAAPAMPWTLESLAQTVSVSRTLLATRFREKVGMTPMRYITLWRMQKARDLLENSKIPIAEIAEQVGYGSEAALSRAFQQQFHMTPGKVRRHEILLPDEA